MERRFVDPQDRIRAKLARLSGAEDVASLGQQIAAIRGKGRDRFDPDRYSFFATGSQTTPTIASTTSLVTYSAHAAFSVPVPTGRWRVDVLVIATYAQNTIGSAVGSRLALVDAMLSPLTTDTSPAAVVAGDSFAVFLALGDEEVVSDGLVLPQVQIDFRAVTGGTATAHDAAYLMFGQRMVL